MQKTGFVYIWYDRYRKMFYIGCHWGREDDGYICSSNRMRKSYRRRPQDFKRRIIQRGIPRESLLEEEFKWLSLIPDEELGKKYYNHSKRHFGHWSANPQKVQSMRERNLGPNNPMYGSKHTDEWKEAARQRMIDNNPFKGKSHTDELKQKWSEQRKGMSSPCGMLGKKHSTETKKKMSEIHAGTNNAFYGRKHSEETKRKISEKRRLNSKKMQEYVL